MQISLYFIIYFCLVKWGNSSIVDSLIICVYTFYIRNKCFEYSLLITASVTCISKSDGSQNSFINLILYTYVYPKPIISFFASYSPEKKKKGQHKAKVLVCPFSAYEISFFQKEMVKIKSEVWETSNLMNQNANIWKRKWVILLNLHQYFNGSGAFHDRFRDHLNLFF